MLLIRSIMMGYTFAILAILAFVALYIAARALGSSRRGRDQRPDYKKGTTYDKPQAEEPTPPPADDRPG